MQRIAIYGGTFDPIHYGHLRSIAELKNRLELDQVRLIPSSVPPHRDSPGASTTQRLEMLRLAVQEFPGLEIDEREMHRSGASYTIDTLAEIRDEVGPDVQLLFVLGSDAFALLHEWHRWQALTDFAHLIIMDRPGLALEAPPPMVLEWLDQRLVIEPDQLKGTHGQIARVALTRVDISATEVRANCAAGECINTLVPERVANFIKLHKLYV